MGSSCKTQGKRPCMGGMFLLVIGGLLLARAGGMEFPSWFFTGPILLIAVGLFIGIRRGFRGGFWMIPILIGGILLAEKLSPELHLRPFIWPVIIIGAGLFIIFRPKGNHCRHGGGPGDNALLESSSINPEDETQWEKAMNDKNNIIDITAVFGGVKKNMLSKNFKGGDVVAFMGGAEINLTQADFKGKVIIDAFNMFGGTKIIVPPDWDVQSGIVAIFGGVDDKRPPSSNVSPDKILYLEGTCIFGGVEIKSY